MRRTFVRRCGIVLAALALPVLMIGTAASAAPTTNKLASATLNGDGSTFQLGFNQVVIGSFKPVQKAVTINYQGNGSGTGRTDFVNEVVDFAGTDAAYKPTDPQPPLQGRFEGQSGEAFHLVGGGAGGLPQSPSQTPAKDAP